MLHALLALALIQQAGSRAGAGTYAVTFCVSECAETETDTTLVMAKGIVVLDTVPEPEEDGSPAMGGCFRIEKLRRVYSYLARSSPERTKWWHISADSIGFWTYRTIDATHTSQVELRGAGFRGEAESVGEGPEEIEVAGEFVIGHRTGPPDQKLCQLPPGKPRGVMQKLKP